MVNFYLKIDTSKSVEGVPELDLLEEGSLPVRLLTGDDGDNVRLVFDAENNGIKLEVKNFDNDFVAAILFS